MLKLKKTFSPFLVKLCKFLLLFRFINNIICLSKLITCHKQKYATLVFAIYYMQSVNAMLRQKMSETLRNKLNLHCS